MALVGITWPIAVVQVDTVAPTANVTIVDITKISNVSGKNALNVTWTADEDFVEYEIRHVNNAEDSRVSGSQVEAAVVGARSAHTVQVTTAELVSAAGVEGSNLLKIFVKDASGNWSD